VKAKVLGCFEKSFSIREPLPTPEGPEITIGLVSLGAGLVSVDFLAGSIHLLLTGHFDGGNALCDRLWSETGFGGSKCCGRDVEVGYVIYCYRYLRLLSAFWGWDYACGGRSCICMYQYLSLSHPESRYEIAIRRSFAIALLVRINIRFYPEQLLLG